MAEWILAVTGARPEEVAVAIDTPHGPAVERLMARGFRLHAINPKQLDRFRDRLSPAGAQDERRDGEGLAKASRNDPPCLRRPDALDPTAVELRERYRTVAETRNKR